MRRRLGTAVAIGAAFLLFGSGIMWIRSHVAADFVIFAMNRERGITVLMESRMEAILLRSGKGMFGIGWARTIVTEFEEAEEIRGFILGTGQPPIQWNTSHPELALPEYAEQWRRLGIMFGRERAEYVEDESIENAAIMISYGWLVAVLGAPLALWMLRRARTAMCECRSQEVSEPV